MRNGEIKHRPLLICSGGTSSRCAANNLITLDLRKKYRDLIFNGARNEISIETGNSMYDLVNELTKFERSFPIGLSSKTGCGYILTGGISPLRRLYGLAIDNLIEVSGIWGNGKEFIIKKPINDLNSNEIKYWRGLCGAAPFLAIITKLKLTTQPLKKTKVWKIKTNQKNLVKLIKNAENWPKSFSLQWFWRESIEAYIVNQSMNGKEKSDYTFITDILSKMGQAEFTECSNQINMPKFGYKNSNSIHTEHFHSEVIGILGPKLKDKSNRLINKIEKLIEERPYSSCFIAAQQLGGMTKEQKNTSSSFIHRKAEWKPWITAAWPAGNKEGREMSLKWLEKAWIELEPFFPGVHLAQIHSHLNFHSKEVTAAFGEWLPELRKLKSELDPMGHLPPL